MGARRTRGGSLQQFSTKRLRHLQWANQMSLAQPSSSIELVGISTTSIFSFAMIRPAGHPARRIDPL
jgi:hypothetical protein